MERGEEKKIMCIKLPLRESTRTKRTALPICCECKGCRVTGSGDIDCTHLYENEHKVSEGLRASIYEGVLKR